MDKELWQYEKQRISIETDAADQAYQGACLMNTPSAIYKPRIMQDGNAWLAILGNDIAVGVVGRGDTPAAAFADFDRVWHQPARSFDSRKPAMSVNVGATSPETGARGDSPIRDAGELPR